MAIRSATSVSTRPQVLRSLPTAPRAVASTRASAVDSFDSGRLTNLNAQNAVTPAPTATPTTTSSKGFFGSLFSGILGGLKSLASSLLGSVQNTVTGAIGGLVTKGKEWLSNTVDSLATRATSWISGLFSKLLGKLGG